MDKIVYGLCALLSMVCAILLVRGYRKDRTRLLLWSGICFSLLCLSNIFLYIDLAVIPDIDFLLFRSSISCLAAAILLFGLIWETT